MSNSEKLTKRKIDSFVYKGGWDVRWDSEIIGFGVRIYSSGKKSYVFSYRIIGRKKLLVLGSANKITLEEARNIAKVKAVEVIKGNDPGANRNQNYKTDLFSNFCAVYMGRHAMKHKKTWKEDQRKINKHILPKLGNISIKAITKLDIMNLHATIGSNAPYEANRILSLLSSLFEFAKKWGYLDEIHPNPTKHIQKFREEKRDRWISKEEIPALIEAIKGEHNLYASMAIMLYLFTGARKSELLNARWQDIHWDNKELRLEDTKSGRIHYIPLSKPAIDLLNSIPKIQDNPHIFPGHNPGRPLINISKPWNRVKKRAGLEDVRLHDLRRTVGSWLAQSGNSLHLIGHILNHSNQSTTAIYARFARDDAREALEEHGKVLDDLINNE